MEEQQFKDTYHAINQRRCVFEKTISSRRSACSKSVRFNLADREGIACKSASGNALCTELLARMRSNARFALHVTHSDEPLPHAKEIRVQTGGLLSMQGLIHPSLRDLENVEDIITTLDIALQRYTSLEQLPYDIIVQGIVKFEGRRKPAPKKDK